MNKTVKLLSIALAITSMAFLSSCGKKTKDVNGCKNAAAYNYNAAATIDDGTCQMPQTDQKTIAWYITGTWCPPCGSYGVPTFDKLGEDFAASSAFVSLHSADIFSCAAGDTLMKSKFFAGNSVPRMGEGAKLVYPAGVTSDVAQNVQKMGGAINSTVSLPMYVGTFLSKSIEGNTLNITTKTKFNDAQSDVDYYLAIYVNENGLSATQSTTTGSVVKIHNHILRTSVTPVFGTWIAGGAIEAGKVIEKTFSRSLPATWVTGNLEYIAVIYYKDAATSTGRTGIANVNFIK